MKLKAPDKRLYYATIIDGHPMCVRDRDIFKMLSQGLPTKQIASEACLSDRSVEGVTIKWRRLLNQTNTISLVSYLIRKNII